MTWREQLLIRILLLIARMLADDRALVDELKHISNHVAVNGPKGIAA